MRKISYISVLVICLFLPTHSFIHAAVQSAAQGDSPIYNNSSNNTKTTGTPATGYTDSSGNTTGNSTGYTDSSGNSGSNGTSGYTDSSGHALFNVDLENPLKASTICGLLKAVLNVVIKLAIPVIIFFIVFAGFKFVIARGNPAALQKAKENLLWTIIGIGIFLGAWTLAIVLTNTINELQPNSVNSC